MQALQPTTTAPLAAEAPINRDADDDWLEREEADEAPQSEEETDWRREVDDDKGYAEQYNDDGNEID